MKMLIPAHKILFVCFLVFLGCDIHDGPGEEYELPGLILVAEYSLEVPEPSGLSLSPDCESLWTVSDQTNRVYRISLTGDVIASLDFSGVDLEGIAYDSVKNCLWIVEEQTRELVKLKLDGSVAESHRVMEGEDNSGLEGICIDVNHNFFCA